MQPRPDDQQRKASSQGAAVTMLYLIQAESHARQAARLIELLTDDDARREARLLILAAQRLRARRLAVSV